MKVLQKAMLLLLIGVFSVNAAAQQHHKLLLWDAQSLKVQKQLFRKGTKDKSILRIMSKADSALQKGPYSVTFNKSKLPPSKDVHDYLSQAPYWWPDSSKANGEPYIRRDGRRNPEIYKLHDRSQLGDFTSTVEDLAMGYYLSGNEHYASRANQLLKIFFIDKKTKMNPNLTYAQYIPGLNDGRGIGIIETRGMVDIPEAIALLSDSQSLQPEVIKGVKVWFADYLNWLQTSINGKNELREKNNHGTNYDLQVVDFALFTGNPALAKKVVQTITIPRLQVQFDADGRQPLETLRTNSWDYVNMNLSTWIKLAQLSDHLGINLWKQTNEKGSGIETAVKWMLPFVKQQKKWPYEQLNKTAYDEVNFIMEVAAKKYPELDLSAL
jgi:hypothetical protein